MAETEKRDILDAVSNVPFPAKKEDLLQGARDNGASDEVIAALREMPPEVYKSRSEVAASVRNPTDDDVPDSPGQRNEQRRRHKKSGLAQHQREAPKPPVEDELDR